MYLDLLEQAVQEIKGEEPPGRIDPEIRLKLEAFIPEDYAPDPRQRMNLYKRLSRATGKQEIDEIEEEIYDLYGKPPLEVSRLMQIMLLRVSMKALRAVRLDYNRKDLVVGFDADTPLRVEALVPWAQKNEHVRLLPGDRLAYRIGDVDDETRINRSLDLLKALAAFVEIKGSTLSETNGLFSRVQGSQGPGLKKP